MQKIKKYSCGNGDGMIEQLKSILRDAYLEGFENGWERKEGGVSAFGVSEDLADKYVNRQPYTQAGRV